MEEMLRGVLGFKGERGFSAYEVAVNNGFIGTEKDWLASIGKSSNFNLDKTLYISKQEQKVFDIPNSFTNDSFIDVYIDGLRLTLNEYTIDSQNKELILKNTLIEGAEVEVVVLTMKTNNLPIVSSINEESLDETAPSARAVYKALVEQLNIIYPINSVIINTSNENPMNYLKNTIWECVLTEQKETNTFYYWKRIL